MFGIDDLFEGAVGGIALGVGVAAVGAVGLLGSRRARPVAVATVKGYLAATEAVREWAAGTSERLQDLYAEAKYEYEAGAAPAPDADSVDGGEGGEGEPAAAPRNRSPRRRRAAAQPA